MPKRIRTKKKKTLPAKKEENQEALKENLEKTGEALGDLFKGVFKGVGRVLDVAQEMEKKGEERRVYQKEIKGVTESGKEFRGEAGWKIGFLESLFRKKDKEDKENN